MDNKIKYVDLNGLKVFAESLKQDLKNHVIELGLYQELLHRIENLELYKIVDSLPEIGDENTIYLLKNPSGSGDKNVFIEYLYNNEHGWEEIGNFTPSFDLEDYLKIENAPFEKGEAENSAVLKGGNNEVTNANEVALGEYNKSNNDTRFSIGIGTSDTDRKNAFEVRQNGDVYIARVEKPIQTELTELSAEVSGLSERVDALGEGGSSVFEAIYGETTYEEIVEAYKAKKHIICLVENKILSLIELNYEEQKSARFSGITAAYNQNVFCNNASSWYKENFTFELITNKVKTISESSTDTQYPSAKAVYEALQNVGGGSDVFSAEYGVTKYNEILEAYNAGKVVICTYNNVVYRLVYAVNIMHFAANVNKTLMYVRCPQSNKWQQSTENTEHSLETLDNGNAKITIAGQTAEVATPQYVENLLGTIINGDY